MNESEIHKLSTAISELITKAEHGLAIDLTDYRVYLVLTIVSLIGSYFGAYFSKRGEINAIKKDLDEITRTQAEIKSKIETREVVTLKWWELKRELYWDLTKSLNKLADAYFNIINYCFNAEKLAYNNPEIYQPYVNDLLRTFDEFMSLTGVAHIAIPDEALVPLRKLGESMRDVSEKSKHKEIKYERFVEMKHAVDETYDALIKIARIDLKKPIENIN